MAHLMIGTGKVQDNSVMSYIRNKKMLQKNDRGMVKRHRNQIEEVLSSNTTWNKK